MNVIKVKQQTISFAILWVRSEYDFNCVPTWIKRIERSDFMSILINIGTVLTGVALISIIIYLMVNKKISESQSVLWLLIGLTTIILGIYPKIINIIADKLGVWYPPSLTFLLAFIAILFIVLKNTIIVSIQSDQINELFLELILAKDQIKDLEKELNSMKEGDEDH